VLILHSLAFSGNNSPFLGDLLSTCPSCNLSSNCLGNLLNGCLSHSCSINFPGGLHPSNMCLSHGFIGNIFEGFAPALTMAFGFNLRAGTERLILLKARCPDFLSLSALLDFLLVLGVTSLSREEFILNSGTSTLVTKYQEQKTNVARRFGDYEGMQKLAPVHPIIKCLQTRAPSIRLPSERSWVLGLPTYNWS